MKSNIEGITEQSGIYAGKEGYDIQVKNNTRLKGAVIDSQAEKEKNRITTGTLTWENIDNKAEYKASGKGISYSTGTGIPLNALGLLSNMGPTVKDKAGTTTQSAVSQGTITITNKENQTQDIEKLNRNTEDSLNKLKEIFDKTKVGEKQELIHMMNIVGNQIIHEAADHYGWKEGSTEKAALHGMLGAITGAKSGGSALSGLIAGGANEYAIEYLKQTKGKDWINKHPDTVQNISAAFGGILSKMTGGSGHTGAYISQMGTKWNELDEEMAAMRGGNPRDGFNEESEAHDEVSNLYSYYEENVSDDIKNRLKREFGKSLMQNVTIKSLELLGEEVKQNYPYLANEVEQKLKGIRFVNKLNKGYGTLVGAAMAYMILADYKQNNSPKTIDEFNKWVEDSVND